MIKKHKRTEDKLNRQPIIDNLTLLIENTKEPLTMSINGGWGSGKTTFVQLWQENLEAKNIHSIYFSAWEDDFSKEPLISILGEINKYIEEKFEKPSMVKSKFKTVKDIGGKIITRALPAFAKSMTGGVLDLDKGIEDAMGALTEQSVKELIDRYSSDKKLTLQFKNSILEVLNLIDAEKPLVIFIDELDRCRPLYAIELLERVKHLFGIERLIFVLSIDKTHLAESIKSQYGNIDTDNYLRRFIDIEYTLPEPSLDKFCNYLYKNFYDFSNVFKEKNINKYTSNNDELALLKYMVNVLNLSLREIEHVFIQLNLAFKTMEKSTKDEYFRVYVLLITLKIKNNDLYTRLIDKRLLVEEKEEFLSKFHKNTNDENEIYLFVKAIMFVCMLDFEEMHRLIKNQKEKINSLTDIEEKNEQNRFVNIIKDLDSYSSYYVLNRATTKVVSQIDFLSQFNLDEQKA